MTRPYAVAALLGVLTSALAACGGGGDDAPSAGGPSGATCPPGSTLRYTGGGNGTTEPADFGATFFATYCTGCHASPPVNGAPISLTTLAAIQGSAAAIDQQAAAGPARTNTSMPVAGGAVPTVAERTLLGAWLACGAPDGAP
jgi:hypothetical protein